MFKYNNFMELIFLGEEVMRVTFFTRKVPNTSKLFVLSSHLASATLFEEAKN